MALIFFIALIVLIVVFSFQNAIPVTVSFLIWEFEISLAAVIAAAAAAGAVLARLFSGIQGKRQAMARRRLEFLNRRDRW